MDVNGLSFSFIFGHDITLLHLNCWIDFEGFWFLVFFFLFFFSPAKSITHFVITVNMAALTFTVFLIFL